MLKTVHNGKKMSHFQYNIIAYEGRGGGNRDDDDDDDHAP